MNPILKYGLIAAVVGGFFLYNSSGDSYTDQDIDLNAALDVTVDTLYAVSEQNTAPQEVNEELQAQLELDMLLDFASQLETNYNLKEPALFAGQIGVEAQQDASFLAYDDKDLNGVYTEGEDVLFLIEIDGENSRIIASSRSGAVNDHHFSGTGLLAGYLIGSMLSRQGKFGNPKGVAGKQSATAKQAAKSRAGSGSHSKGK